MGLEKDESLLKSLLNSTYGPTHEYLINVIDQTA